MNSRDIYFILTCFALGMLWALLFEVLFVKILGELVIIAVVIIAIIIFVIGAAIYQKGDVEIGFKDTVTK